jgi:hypothetical protein
MKHITRHAHARVRQRAVPPIVLDWLIAYGSRVPAGKGIECIFLDKKGRRRLQHDLGAWAYARLEPKFDTYAIVANDGAIVTTGYRTRRINR